MNRWKKVMQDTQGHAGHGRDLGRGEGVPSKAYGGASHGSTLNLRNTPLGAQGTVADHINTWLVLGHMTGVGPYDRQYADSAASSANSCPCGQHSRPIGPDFSLSFVVVGLGVGKIIGNSKHWKSIEKHWKIIEIPLENQCKKIWKSLKKKVAQIIEHQRNTLTS